jgi:hypothetical protein
MFSKKIILLVPFLTGCHTNSFFGGPKDVEEKDVELSVEQAVPSSNLVEVIPLDNPVTPLGALDLPSIYTENPQPKIEEKGEEKKAVKVIKMGEEKIRVIDNHMGSVESDELQELRGQRQ